MECSERLFRKINILTAQNHYNGKEESEIVFQKFWPDELEKGKTLKIKSEITEDIDMKSSSQ